MPKKHKWQNAEGKWVPYEVYEGKPKEQKNASAYLSGGYRYSERRKSEILRQLKKKDEEESINKLLGNLFPQLKSEFINNKNH